MADGSPRGLGEAEASTKEIKAESVLAWGSPRLQNVLAEDNLLSQFPVPIIPRYSHHHYKDIKKKKTSHTHPKEWGMCSFPGGRRAAISNLTIPSGLGQAVCRVSRICF